MLLNHTIINNHFIDLINNKQPYYIPIYSLKLVKFKMLKTYIETNLANGFIRSFYSLINTSIVFIFRKDGKLWLFIDYQGFNTLIIKNNYQLSLINKFFNCLGYVKHFT